MDHYEYGEMCGVPCIQNYRCMGSVGASIILIDAVAKSFADEFQAMWDDTKVFKTIDPKIGRKRRL